MQRNIMFEEFGFLKNMSAIVGGALLALGSLFFSLILQLAPYGCRSVAVARGRVTECALPAPLRGGTWVSHSRES